MQPTKLDLAALEPADFIWSPVFPTNEPEVAAVAGGRYRVVFNNKHRHIGFYNRACYYIDTITEKEVTLRGYAQVFPRNEVQFYSI